MSKPIFRSIMLKILLMIFLVSISEALILAYMSHTMTESTIESLVHKRSEANEELYADMLGNWFSERINEIQMYASCIDVKSMDWEIAEPYLKNEIAYKLDYYDHFLVADTAGNYNTTIRRNPSNIKDRAYFKEVMSGISVISAPITSRVTGNHIIIVAAPVKNTDGKVAGLMGGSINLIKLGKIIAPFKVNHPGSYSYIIDKTGQIITHPDASIITKENITKSSGSISQSMVRLSHKVLSSSSGNGEFSLGNDRYMLYYAQIPNTDNWRILTIIPLDYLNEPLSHNSRTLMLIGLVGVLISVLAGIAVSRTISKPIIQLKNIFIQAEKGDLSVVADIDTHDEIEDAAQSFNRMMQTINNLTFNDPLTGLPNAASFMEHLELAVSNAEKYNEKAALMVIDIDKFENINNTLGHSVGNELLKIFARKLGHEHIQCEALSRISEDKFALLFTDIAHKKNILLTAQNILEIIKQPADILGHKLFITAGIGIAFYPSDAATSEILFKNAYSAMQRAKRAGRDNYQLYDQTISNNLSESLILDTSMHNALNNGEFILHYQPQINLITNKVIGMEALLRWMHPEFGLVSPIKFIPIAESNGLIVPIGYWVLDEACRQTRKLHELGHKDLYVSVNISAIQLQQDNFVEKVTSILRAAGLQPCYLELEITESVVMENTFNRIETLKALRNMGIRLAIDDFGTGYSSLNYLKSFELNTLKIDKSFIMDIANNPKDAAIVSAILAIGHNLQLSVTAEGVETDEQLAILRSKKCDAIQGYLYSKPVPINEFELMLKK